MDAFWPRKIFSSYRQNTIEADRQLIARRRHRQSTMDVKAIPSSCQSSHRGDESPKSETGRYHGKEKWTKCRCECCSSGRKQHGHRSDDDPSNE